MLPLSKLRCARLLLLAGAALAASPSPTTLTDASPSPSSRDGIAATSRRLASRQSGTLRSGSTKVAPRGPSESGAFGGVGGAAVACWVVGAPPTPGAGGGASSPRTWRAASITL